MARVKSAREHGFQSPISVAESQLPRQGTKLREAYDCLLANKGRRIPTKTIPSRIRRDLEEYYGCVIEYKGYGNCDMIFVGEMRGDQYIEFAKQNFQGEKNNS
jgi:hypothetical protein